MSGTREEPRSAAAGTRLTLDLWHPDCWAIEATEAVGGGVLAHAVYTAPESNADADSVNGLFTAFGGSESEVDALLEHVRGSDLAGEVLGLQERFGGPRGRTPGTVAREFFLEYDPREMVCPTLLEHGFVHSAPVRIEDGREYWQVCYAGERTGIGPALDRVREDAGAEVTVSSVTAASTERPERERRVETLTAAQREVFEHARARGYYRWPRGTSTRELAEDLDISKTTLLEHLRKAEGKLLAPEQG